MLYIMYNNATRDEHTQKNPLFSLNDVQAITTPASQIKEIQS